MKHYNNMILNNIQNLITEGSHLDIIKGDLHNLGELGAGTAARHKYVRLALAKHGKKATEEELDELTSKRGKHGIVGGLAGGLAGSF